MVILENVKDIKLSLTNSKIDFFRYIAIYHFGGIYLDLDIECKKNMIQNIVLHTSISINEYINQALMERNQDMFYNDKQHLLGQYTFKV